MITGATAGKYGESARYGLYADWRCVKSWFPYQSGEFAGRSDEVNRRMKLARTMERSSRAGVLMPARGLCVCSVL